MLKSPTYIHFRVEWHLLGPDAPNQRFDQKQFLELLSTLNNDPMVGDYNDFSYRHDRSEFAKVRGDRAGGSQGFSKIVFANDQLQVVEEWADLSAEEFAGKFTGILTAWFRHFPKTFAVIQRCCLRALMAPVNFGDSRDFVGDRVLGLGKSLAANLMRMPHKVGFTVSCVREIQGAPLVIDTKVNSWRDNRSVWLEVAGAMPLSQPINAAGVERARVPFEACQTFLEREIAGLLAKFDTTDDAGVGE